MANDSSEEELVDQERQGWIQASGEVVVTKLKKNWIAILGGLAVPCVAALTDGGDWVLGLMAGLTLSGSVMVLEDAIDLIIDNAEKVLRPEYLVLLLAGTTNIPELAASQASALFGDLLPDVAATPLGSNHANLTLAGIAILAALSSRARTEGLMGGSDFLTPKIARKTLKTLDWKKIGIQGSWAGVFLAEALIFQYVIRPLMHSGDYTYFLGWLTLSASTLGYYFYHTTFSKEAKIKALLDGMDSSERAKVVEVMSEIETFRPVLPHLSEDDLDVKGLVRELEGIQSPESVQLLSEMAESSNFSAILGLSGHQIVEERKISEKEKKEIITKVLFGMLLILAVAPALDWGVSGVADSIPWFGKTEAGFFILAYISSLGEFLTTKKFFERGGDLEGMKNIADSNALNLLIAKLAMLTGTAVYLHHAF